MAEKLNRDRSTRNQTRTTTNSSKEIQNSSRRQFSSFRGEMREINQPSLKTRDKQNNKAAGNYPPLEDYAE